MEPFEMCSTLTAELTLGKLSFVLKSEKFNCLEKKMQKRPRAKGTIEKPSSQKSHLGLCVDASRFLNQNIHSEVGCNQLVKAYFAHAS